VEGQTLDLAPSEIIVSTQPAEGLAVASDKLATVAVDATLTPELKAEGLAREVVRRVQAMRKDAGVDIADRISTGYQGDRELAACSRMGSLIMSELTTRLVMERPRRPIGDATWMVTAHAEHLAQLMFRKYACADRYLTENRFVTEFAHQIIIKTGVTQLKRHSSEKWGIRRAWPA
jgi:hypothetical protein